MQILTINAGSSSLKFSVYEMGPPERMALTGLIDRIGVGDSVFRATNGKGEAVEPLTAHRCAPLHHDAAIESLLAWLGEQGHGRNVDAVGHRIVHGGPAHSRPEAVTPSLIALLKELVPLAPDHLPQEIRAIEAVGRLCPEASQVACFDTAFHRQMPRLAQLYGLPRGLYEEGVMRYGFHGLSCEYILDELRQEAGDSAAEGRAIIAHLGNGAGMVATRGGRSIEATMGFTPTGGLVMSTRSGDLDPSVVLYLLLEKGLSAREVSDLVNHQAGLLGVSGTTSDMRDLLGREADDERASEAVALFCYQARKHLGALAAALGGLDTLIFTAGIGERAPEIRRRICQDLEFIGIQLDRERNEANAPIISRDGSHVTVRVMKTNEELMIARHTYRVVCERRR